MLFEKQGLRLIIYFFFDEEGVVDSYVEYMLNSLKKYAKEFLVVCNGILDDEGKRILEKYGPVLIRKNDGFDVWAYKDALLYVGWEKLCSFHEIILMNNTIMGPVCSWNETFEKMNSKDLDFWGITKSFRNSNNFIGCDYGYIPEHIQSHFIACRNSLVSSAEFQNYWNNMPLIKKYEDSIKKHEVVFTKYFEEKGFKWDISVESEALREYVNTPLLECPMQMLSEKKCPIFKRRSFFQDPGSYLEYSAGENVSRLVSYIDNTSEYPMDLIWDTILRKYHQADIIKNLNLVYILPKNDIIEPISNSKVNISKIALIFHVYFEDLLTQTFNYIVNMPKIADIYITTDTCEKKSKIKFFAEKSGVENVEIRIIPNKGRDISSLLVGVKDIIHNYEVVCFAHDKKAGQISPKSVGVSFAYKCYENVLANEKYIFNILNTFATHPRLGMLVPPEPNHGIYFQVIGGEWGNNYEMTKNLKEELKVKVPMDISKSPIAPFGTMFWFRPEALKSLYAKDWDYIDFPDEPNAEDGTILHAIERIYPFIVQSEGFYPAIVMNNEYAAIEYGNLHYAVRKYNEVLIKKNWGGDLSEMSKKVERELNSFCGIDINKVKGKSKEKIKKVLKKVIPSATYQKVVRLIKCK